ncbi:MAG: type II toxin-antitoxin system VapC family toxin [Polaromonas sp.]|uniref:type II toxin-antitoxin system VapC family toxin n=1 Tax=Polaromonas sp. TaxID=1869339 RepID=UPI002735724F|nr:type II toxin-antitoxin system VapC family toxin [Polaromonas sp.]MDP2820113.1 type II toxin-antitoxin system VapC family toxin [Polaromonas sp.]
MMSHVLLLDTNVWSHMILGDPAMRTVVTAQLAALRLTYPGATLATSGICVAECLVAARRLLDPVVALQFEAEFTARFAAPGVVIVPVTEQVLDRAAKLRADRLKLSAALGGQAAGPKGGKLLLPDAIIAASCLDFQPPAILVTENAADFRYKDNGVPKTVADLTVEGVGTLPETMLA